MAHNWFPPRPPEFLLVSIFFPGLHAFTFQWINRSTKEPYRDWSRAGQCSWGCTFTMAEPCVCPFLLMCLQMCQQHTACQGSTLETLRRLQKSLVLTLPYVFGLQFFDSRGDFCLILEEEKEGSSLQDCLMVPLQLMEKCGSIRHQSQLELFQRLDSSCKTRRSISIVLTILRAER